MGQIHPKNNRDISLICGVSHQEEKLKFAKKIALKSSSANEPSCLTLCLKSKDNQKQEWKKLLKWQLERLNLGEWPLLLLKVLKRTNTSKVDRLYQADCVWVAHKASDARRVRKTRNRFDSTNFLGSEENESKIESYRDFKENFGSETTNMPKMCLKDQSFYISAPNNSKSCSYSIGHLTYKESTIEPNIPQNTGCSKTLCLEDVIQNRVDLSENSCYDDYTILSQTIIDSPIQGEGDNHRSSGRIRYKEIMQVIERHIKTENSIFRMLINKFEQFFNRKYTTTVRAFRQRFISLEELTIESMNATTDVQQFIAILYETLVVYYALDKVKKEHQNTTGKYLNRDNLISFITSIILNDKIYGILFSLYSAEEFETEVLYQRNLSLCKNFGPEKFGVPYEFCLNSQTLTFFKKDGLRSDLKTGSVSNLNTLRSNELLKDQIILISHDSGDCEDKVEIHRENLIEISKSVKPMFNQDTIPYSEVVMKLMELENYKSPVHKLKSIMQITNIINNCIKIFYQEFDIRNGKMLEADEILPLFVYLVAASGLKNISAHFRIIEMFSTKNMLCSVSNYYATTLLACRRYICELKFEDNLVN